MIALHELQSIMGRALLGHPTEASSFVEADGIGGEARLAIYAHHVTTTLTEALASTFPVVQRLVAPGFFAYAADAYVRAQPPGSPCLFEYGAGFPDFLGAFPPCGDLPWLADVGRLEWAINVARHAADTVPIEPSTLAALTGNDAGRVCLRLDPSLSFLESPWAVDALWTLHQHEDLPASLALDAADVRVQVRRVTRRVTRRDGEDVTVKRLPAAEFAFRRTLGTGASLARASAAALERSAEFDLTASLVELLRETLVVGFGIERDEGGPPEWQT